MPLVRLCPGHTENFISWIRDWPSALTIVYVDDRLVAYTEIHDSRSLPHLGKRSLSFGGAIHPDHRDKALLAVAAAIIRRAFLESPGKEKMLASTDDGNRQAQAYLA